MRCSSCLVTIALSFVLVSSLPAIAQDPADAGARARSAQQQRERLMEMFLDQATIELNLTEEQRGGLEVVLREAMERRAELARSQQALRREIGDALSDPSTGADEFRRLADASVALKAREVELLEWQHGRLLDVLTPRQSLRFMLLQERLAQRIETMRRTRGRQQGSG